MGKCSDFTFGCVVELVLLAIKHSTLTISRSSMVRAVESNSKIKKSLAGFVLRCTEINGII